MPQALVGGAVMRGMGGGAPKQRPQKLLQLTGSDGEPIPGGIKYYVDVAPLESEEWRQEQMALSPTDQRIAAGWLKLRIACEQLRDVVEAIEALEAESRTDEGAV